MSHADDLDQNREYETPDEEQAQIVVHYMFELLKFPSSKQFKLVAALCTTVHKAEVSWRKEASRVEELKGIVWCCKGVDKHKEE